MWVHVFDHPAHIMPPDPIYAQQLLVETLALECRRKMARHRWTGRLPGNGADTLVEGQQEPTPNGCRLSAHVRICLIVLECVSVFFPDCLRMGQGSQALEVNLASKYQSRPQRRGCCVHATPPSSFGDTHWTVSRSRHKQPRLPRATMPTVRKTRNRFCAGQHRCDSKKGASTDAGPTSSYWFFFTRTPGHLRSTGNERLRTKKMRRTPVGVRHTPRPAAAFRIRHSRVGSGMSPRAGPPCCVTLLDEPPRPEFTTPAWEVA